MCIRDRFSPGHYVGVIGCLTDAQKVQGSCAPFRCTDKSATDEPSITNDIQRLSTVFDVVRLVDPTKYAVLDLDADGILHRTGAVSYTHLDVYKRQIRDS